jgi:hypothetical protein
MEDHTLALLEEDQEVLVVVAEALALDLEALETLHPYLPHKEMQVKVDRHLKEHKVVAQEQLVHLLELILQESPIVLTEHQENMLAVVVQDQVVQLQ